MNAAGRDGAGRREERIAVEKKRMREMTAEKGSGSGGADRRRNWVDLFIILLTSGAVIVAYLAVMGE